MTRPDGKSTDPTLAAAAAAAADPGNGPMGRPRYSKFRRAMDPPQLEKVRKLAPVPGEAVQRGGSRSFTRLSPARVACALAFLVGLVLGGALAQADLVSWLRSEAVSTEMALGALPETASVAAVIPAAPSDPPSPAETSAPDAHGPPSAVIELGDEFRIQLAALDSEAEVGAMWDGFVTEFAPLVRGLERYVVKMRSASGVLYLVQVGPFDDLQQAMGTCDELNRQDADCVVIRRLRQARAPAPQVPG